MCTKEAPDQNRYVRIDGVIGRQEFESVKAGDRFQLFEPDDTFVGSFIAVSDAYLNKDGVWTIENELNIPD